jgi:hypothetical protein
MGKTKNQTSNNFLIWAILFIIAFGFSKCGNILGTNITQVNKCCNTSRKHSRNNCNPKPGYGNNLLGLPGMGFLPGMGASQGGFMGGNGIFIIAIVALLFLCKDEGKPVEDNTIIVEENEEEI